jgi:hypothetical protein
MLDSASRQKKSKYGGKNLAKAMHIFDESFNDVKH